MTTIDPLDWTTNPSGDYVLAVGRYLAVVIPGDDDYLWLALYDGNKVAGGRKCTPERAKADAEDAITNHQIGAAA